MIINRDALVFSLTVAIISAVVNIVSMQFGVKSITFLNTLIFCVSLFIVASVGFLLGQKISKHTFAIKHAFFAGVFTFACINNLNRVFDFGQYYLFIDLPVLFFISVLLAWKLPRLFRLKSR